jgi:hypothetical protein
MWRERLCHSGSYKAAWVDPYQHLKGAEKLPSLSFVRVGDAAMETHTAPNPVLYGMDGWPCSAGEIHVGWDVEMSMFLFTTRGLGRLAQK